MMRTTGTRMMALILLLGVTAWVQQTPRASAQSDTGDPAPEGTDLAAEVEAHGWIVYSTRRLGSVSYASGRIGAA